MDVVPEALLPASGTGVLADGDGPAKTGVAESVKESLAPGITSEFFGAGAAAGFGSPNASAEAAGGLLEAISSPLPEAGFGGAVGCELDAAGFCAPGALGVESAKSDDSTCPLASLVVA